MTATLPIAVLRAVDAAAADHSVDRSTVLTDIVCLHYGRPDLVRHQSQQLSLEILRATKELTVNDRRIGPHVKVRPPRAVADMVTQEYQRLGIGRSTLLADIVCQYLGFPELVRELNTKKEGLPLAM
jgi:hypothetical protein